MPRKRETAGIEFMLLSTLSPFMTSLSGRSADALQSKTNTNGNGGHHKNNVMRTRKTSNPEWARKILGLRRRMGLTQSAFASRLHYSAMALSRWERGTHEPPAQAYIQIGNLIGEPESSWFWERAGFKSSDLSKMVPEGRGVLRKSIFPEFDIVVAGSHHKSHAAISPRPRLVAIPVLP